MAIASGKAHSTWVELKKKEGKQGTKNVDKLFQKKLGPTLDDFDKACKAGKVDDATKLKDKIAEILKGYLKISESLKLKSEFKSTIGDLEKYLTTNLPKPKVTKPSGPPKLPSGFVFKTQGSDGRCAYYALCHFRNSNLSVDDYLAKATNFYLSNGIGEDESAAWDFADDGNDPQVLAAFGVTEKGFGSGDQYIVARTSGGSPHFYCVRKIQGDWWVFDSLKAKPEHLGDASAVKKYIGSNKTYA